MTFPGYFKDHILPENIENLSLSFLVDSLTRVRGGIAPNIAYTLALLGEKSPVVFATVGQDFDEYAAWLKSNGVETKYIRVIKDVYTASFFANTDKANSQIASFYSGAMTFARDYSLSTLDFRPDIVVISPNDPEAMNLYVRECVEMGIPYLFDPSQQIVRMSGEDIRKGVEGAHCLFVNEYEYQLLQKHTGLNPQDILQSVEFLVVTRGAEGSEIYAEGNVYHVPVVAVENIVDPTGVGDAFRGGFLRGYQLGFDWVLCGQMGALAAAYCLEQQGTQAHAYSLEEYITRFRNSFDDSGKLNQLL